MLPIKSPVKVRLLQLFDELLEHDGFGNMKIEMRLLRRGQKEVIVDCGKQYRFVVDFQSSTTESTDNKTPASLATD